MRFKALLTLLVIIFLSFVAYRGFMQLEGQVYLTANNWLLDTDLKNFLLKFVIPAFVITFLTIILLIWLWRAPTRMGRFFREQRTVKARNDAIDAAILLREDANEKAEKTAIRNAEHSDIILMNFLIAARAAHAQGDYTKRDVYFQKAIQHKPFAKTAMQLALAELQLNHLQNDSAQVTIRQLQKDTPNHTQVMRLLVRYYRQTHQLDKAVDLLPTLRKRKAFSETELLDLERDVYTEVLQQAVNARKARRHTSTEKNSRRKVPAAESIEQVWLKIPKVYRQDQALIALYLQALADEAEPEQMEKIVRDYLNSRWDESLIQFYGNIKTQAPEKQLGHAEAWLKEQGQSPMLLFTLGKLCHRLKLWAKAKSYYQKSLDLLPSLSVYEALAELHADLNDKDQAYQALQKAVKLASQNAGNRRASDRKLLTDTHINNDKNIALKPAQTTSAKLPVPVDTASANTASANTASNNNSTMTAVKSVTEPVTHQGSNEAVKPAVKTESQAVI